MRICTNRLWRDRLATREFRTAVSLHSHTLHSREMLAVLLRGWRKLTFQNWRPTQRQRPSFDLDITRLWWTPPLSPRQAWTLERRQIETRLDCEALVSITDHDNIEAPLALRVLEDSRNTPVSVEWTVPYGPTFYHLGIHNMEARRARSLFAEMCAWTARPRPQRLRELLVALNEDPRTLVVFNHPLWDEKGIGKQAHRRTVESFLREHRGLIHAFELNGFRTGKENRRVEELSVAARIPAISGGDRHGLEPNSNVNLTNACSFEEFASEVREDGVSHILWMPQQNEGLGVRVLRTACDVVREDPRHGMGWTRWHDRVFYRADDGVERPLSEIWRDGSEPRVLGGLVAAVQLLDRGLAHPRLRAFVGRTREDEAGL